MENKGEQENRTPTEDSQGFVGRWMNRLAVPLGVTTAGLNTVASSLYMIAGNEQLAVIHGGAAVTFGVATALYEAKKTRDRK